MRAAVGKSVAPRRSTSWRVQCWSPLRNWKWVCSGERPWTRRSRVVKAETYSWGDPVCRRSARASQAEKALLAGRNWAIRESRNPFQERSRGWAGSEQQRRHHSLAAPVRKVAAVRRRSASVETSVLVKYSSRSHRKLSRVQASRSPT